MGVAAVLVRAFVPESPVQAGPKRVDVPGALLLSAALVALLVALTEGNAWGWTGGRTLGLLAGAVVLGLLWGRVERRSSAPLVDLGMLARRPVLLTNLSTLCCGAATFGMFLLIPAFLQTPTQFAPQWHSLATYGFAASASVASFLLVPGSAVQLVVAPLTGKLMPRFGARGPFVLSAAFVMMGPLLLALFHDREWQPPLALGVMGVGVAMGLATAPKLIGDAVAISETGVANGINMIMRTIGGVVGAQLVAALVAARTIGDSPVPAEWGYVAAWWATVACGALGVAVALPLLRRNR